MRSPTLTSMRVVLLSLMAASAVTVASATPLPVGSYDLTAHTSTTGIHQSVDQGILTGTLTFDAGSVLTSANLTFDDLTAGTTFSFTNVGATDFGSGGQPFESAVISNAVDPTMRYFFSIRTPGALDGSFRLTCGTDCETDVLASNGGGLLNEEVTGTISPSAAAVTPEPSSLVLLGTGIVGVLGVARRRFSK